MAGVAKLFDGHILNKSNEKVDLNDEKYKEKIIGLYFSAHWCHLCPDFTPVLIEFYKKHAKEKNFEIIFLSFDNDEESFKEYYQDMPWLTLDYDQEDKRDELKDKFNVHGFPTFILLDGESGQIICQNAKIQIQTKDTEGEKFPWKSIE